jgi:signal peptide peptidase SppA
MSNFYGESFSAFLTECGIEPGSYWLGSPASFHGLQNAVYQLYQQVTPSEFGEMALKYAEEGEDGEDGEDEGNFDGYDHMINMHGNVAIVSVSGPMVPKTSFITEFFGITSYEDIRNALAAVVNSKKAKAIVMNWDTPGGAVSGTKETSDLITKIDTRFLPVYSSANSNMLSAGMWLGSSARDISANTMSSVGSIGVVAIHVEMSEAMKRSGITTTVFRAGARKALGDPYSPLSKKASEEIQSDINYIHTQFMNHVAEERNMSPSEITAVADGRTFWGPEAKKIGLVDNIRTLEELVDTLNEVHAHA